MMETYGNSGYPATGIIDAGGGTDHYNVCSGFGTKAAAIAAGTTNTGAKTRRIQWFSWSEVGDLNSGRGV